MKKNWVETQDWLGEIITRVHINTLFIWSWVTYYWMKEEASNGPAVDLVNNLHL